jgi:NAD(P)-dependent dehydrogenase (short-subunit alcohol dehydrogenase family)
MKEAASGIPWSRLGRASDIGNAAAFLVCDGSEYITGASLVVDGGYMVGLSLPFTARQEGNDMARAAADTQ